MGEWPVSYCIITVPANPEVAQHQERHGAAIHRRQVMQWLDLTVPETDLLATPPPRTFVVEETVDAPRQSAFLLLPRRCSSTHISASASKPTYPALPSVPGSLHSHH